MANEFVARRGIIAQSGGAKITGSLLVSGAIDASGYNIIAQSFTGSFSGSIGTATSASYVQWNDVDNKPTNLVSSSTQVKTFLPDGTVSSSAQYPGWVTSSTQIVAALPNGTVSSSAQYPGWVTASSQINITQVAGYATLATTGSNVFVGNQIISGSLTTTADTMNFNGSMAVSGTLSITGSVNNVSGGFTGSFKGDGSQLTGIPTTLAISGSTAGTDSLNLVTDALVFSGSNGITATVTNNTVTLAAPAGTVSASNQIDITSTTGYSTFSSSIATKNDSQDIAIAALSNVTGSYATTASNSFTGVQTITNTTNSTNYTDGALVVQGGVGITKNVNISGSLTVSGLLTAISMSTQYVTSSQYVVGDNKIILAADDVTRFGGISIFDSGSTSPTTASIYWDSLNHKFIYENLSGSDYGSAIIIGGPKNTGPLGSEPVLTVGRIPVTTGEDHIDSRQASSSIRIDFNTKETHVESGLYITGSVTSSIGFKGDGSQLTGIVTTLAITGSDLSTDTIDLKTSGLTFNGGNGITTTVASDTVTISAPVGTVSSSGQVKNLLPTDTVSSSAQVTAFLPADTVSSSTQVKAFLPIGTVSSSAQYPGWVTASSQIQLNQITGTTFAAADFTFPQKLTVTGVVTASTAANISAGLYSGSIVTNIVGAVTNQVVATLPSTYDGVFFDYVVKDGTNYRTGTVIVTANSTNVEFTDISTADIGNTVQENFTVDIVGGLIRLKFTSGTGTWTVKTIIRAL